jgi:hypothetical protein
MLLGTFAFLGVILENTTTFLDSNRLLLMAKVGDSNAGPKLVVHPEDPEPYQTCFFPGVFDIVDAALTRHGVLSEVPLKAAA